MSAPTPHALDEAERERLVEPSRLSPVGRFVATVVRSREMSILLVLILVVAVTTIHTSQFLFSTDGWRDLLVTPAILMALAVGEAVVIITRNVDLSVGSILGLTAYLTGRMFIDYHGLPVIVVIAAAIAAGAVLGLANGVVVAFARVPSLVITLGTLYIYRGIVLTWAGSNRINADQMPNSFLNLGDQSILGLPVLFLVSFAALVIVGYYLYAHRGGREFYAIGSDPQAADLYGLNVLRRIVAGFVLSGALAGLAGAMFAARYGTVASDAGTGIELQAVAAAVIGGVAIFGGSGTVWGAAIGAVLLVTINRALPVLGVQDFWQQAVVGGLIIGAITLDRALAARRARKFVEAREA